MADSRPLLPPFSDLSALCKQRLIPLQSHGQPSFHQKSRSPPDNNPDPDQPITHVPGEPSTSLTQTAVCDFLTSELSTPLLDELYSCLWLVARRCGKSIDSLHRQKVKTREIVANEDANLHLVWHYNKIYIKPLPLCLLNYDFWTTYLPLQADSTSSEKGTFAIRPVPPSPVFDRAVAVGFMRSYALLVRHHVDFILARESHLFPAELDWVKWSEFIAHFRNIKDEDVAKRYHYGQLRLLRLNWVVRLFRPSSATTWWFYEIPHWSTAIYVERALAPLLFGFASLSLVLSAMQILRSVPHEELGFKHLDASSLVDIRRAFWVFSAMILLLSGLVWVLLFVIPLGGLIWQLAWGFRNRGIPKVKPLGNLDEKLLLGSDPNTKEKRSLRGGKASKVQVSQQ
ncbi:hypothetical protein GJ744_006444 [Endocarpon pusillum]|uniref:Uncharacterized protein n=1 Tax=Endocarpon pusillum TaxID=364733 RepID=A0A8H7A7S5_9EURO|nr:hypothetical protein GJ744_006444 [Endocarpon pusillum]